ncbi:type III toxin-antitoxin system ToxN/AbiQ family toxin [Bacillus sp. HNG]|uniref:type III toxin-antitoxin system ToxN/AbiQ family toxin n=1 Tax=Bacillus sp. HNG TaxID=2293325 RepID=UPI000E2EBAC5|nr:type III toxin-antitoxin system ToxN/AbiQ family toxin [Bacillus sp. HNG]RFB11467.1 type III toxin-antitoxin system ToxN/AbiQ family toxin [Bacillus sp. HNG]
MDKLQFYRVSDDYINFLRNVEPKVQHNRYENRDRAYVGIVLTMGGIHNYFAPLSSYKPETHDSVRNKSLVKIYGKDQSEKLAVLKLNNMFPILPTVITRIDFNQEDYDYKRLLIKEYSYIIKHQNDIQNKARSLYNDVANGHSFFSRLCCNFALLEQEYVKYGK